MMGLSVGGLLNQNDRNNNRGTAGNVSKRSDKIKTFSIKGQAIHPM